LRYHIGQEPVFYTVQPGDTLLEIAEQGGITMEEMVTINRIGVHAPGAPTPLPVLHYGTLLPGTRVLIRLEESEAEKTVSAGGREILLSEADLNCDGLGERISGIEAPEIEYFNIHPQISEIRLETNTERDSEIVWK
jgi:hypothetical protein